jgi:5'-phosphate synthase pdxT subunit
MDRLREGCERGYVVKIICCRQGLIGGMDISVHRNFFGRQISSFETEISLNLPTSQTTNPPTTPTSPSTSHFPGVFIRAPAILGVKEGVKILGEINPPSSSTSSSTPNNHTETKVIVAAQQGPLLATVFHPELTSDKRVHEYFVEMVRENQEVCG